MSYDGNHTRQGTARGQRHGTLDVDWNTGVAPETDAMWAHTSHTAMNARRHGSGTGEHLRVIATSGCWCGKPYPHTWPGEKDGAPHPR